MPWGHDQRSSKYHAATSSDETTGYYLYDLKFKSPITIQIRTLALWNANKGCTKMRVQAERNGDAVPLLCEIQAPGDAEVVLEQNKEVTVDMIRFTWYHPEVTNGLYMHMIFRRWLGPEMPP